MISSDLILSTYVASTMLAKNLWKPLKSIFRALIDEMIVFCFLLILTHKTKLVVATWSKRDSLVSVLNCSIVLTEKINSQNDVTLCPLYPLVLPQSPLFWHVYIFLLLWSWVELSFLSFLRSSLQFGQLLLLIINLLDFCFGWTFDGALKFVVGSTNFYWQPLKPNHSTSIMRINTGYV